MEKIKHPFIAELKYAFQTSEKLYMVTEFKAGGELYSHLKREGKFNEERARFYAAEVILALECLHAHNIVYRDLKPENVLLDSEGHVCLTDFGLSKILSGSSSVPTSESDPGMSEDDIAPKAFTFCGTPEYIAPEVIMGVGHDRSADWWSLGSFIYEMLTGRPPYTGKTRREIYTKIVSCRPHL